MLASFEKICSHIKKNVLKVDKWQLDKVATKRNFFHQQLIFLQDKITLRFCSTRQPREHLSHCRDVPPDKLSKKTWFSKEGRREGVWGQVKRCSTTKFWKSFGNLYKSSREMGSNGEVLLGYTFGNEIEKMEDISYARWWSQHDSLFWFASYLLI